MATGQMESVVSDEDIRSAFAGGSLAVLVTRARSKALFEELVGEAARLGIPVTGFFMDEGVTLLSDQAWVRSLPEGRYAACDVSARRSGVEPPERIIAGGQYQNATMVHDAARVVSL